jgi:hypothetical protein
MTTSCSPPSDGADNTGATGGATADTRLAAMTASLASRLRAVCRERDDSEFDALAARIAQTKLRWADRGFGE